MIDTCVGNALQSFVQLHRIGCGQRAWFIEARAVYADGAEAHSLMPQLFPNLAQERGGRSLAVGSGDRSHVFRLAPIKIRRHQRESAPGISIFDNRNFSGRAHRPQNADSALFDGGFDEVAAIDVYAGQCGKQVARTHGTGITGQARDLQIAI